MQHTEHSVTIDAPVHVVWEIVKDAEGYARIFPPTKKVEILEQSDVHEVIRLLVEVDGNDHTWVSRREIDFPGRVISFHQIEPVPMLSQMGGEWRVFELDGDQTQLVLTHDYALREAVDGLVAGVFAPQEAARLVEVGVERNSLADLGAVKTAAETRHGGAKP
ncbi:aromatase/cyclase [Streptomyces sp. NPDC001139]